MPSRLATRSKKQWAQPENNSTIVRMLLRSTPRICTPLCSPCTINPQELRKGASVCAQWVFDGSVGWKFESLRNAQSTLALRLAFYEDFHGDRVIVLITGLHTTVIAAYGGITEFLFPNDMDPQRLAIAAYNIDLAISMLHPNQSKDATGTGSGLISIVEKIPANIA